MERGSRTVIMRVDLLLVKKNLVSTRTRAQEMIKGGQVFVVINGQKRLVEKAREEFHHDAEFELVDGFANEFVSRAGHKIKGAAESLKLAFTNKTCLDVGVSTGGFTDFLLRSGAKHVVGIDVGQDQTHSSIRNDSRFTLLEKVNARYLNDNKEFLSLVPSGGFDFICMDVSFISVRLILPSLKALLHKNGELLVLIKPQFELGPEALNEKGIVKDPSRYLELENVICKSAQDLGFKIEKFIPSPIEGKDGNKEFFVLLT